MIHRSTQSSRYSPCAVANLLPCCLLLLLGGCGGSEPLDSSYGARRGSHADSVAGTTVLAEMFERAGHDVGTWKRLSPKLEQYQIIVWAPDDFQPPTLEQREWLEEWLREEEGRRLVYIGRDYDASTRYWEKMRPIAPPEQIPEISRELAKSRSDFSQARSAMPKEGYARWFTARRDGQLRSISSLEGPWSKGIDASQLDMEIEGRLEPSSEDEMPEDEWSELPYYDTLLASEGEPIVYRTTDIYWGDSEVIVVANGSFLLNLPLVNHEHRKLAAKLIAECGPPGKVVFLETGPGGPEIRDYEEGTAYPTGLEPFTVWPMSAVAIHLTLLGITLCIALFPIFGRPRGLPPEPLSDFGKHIDSLGELLQKTKDSAYARGRIQHYHEQARRDSGAVE